MNASASVVWQCFTSGLKLVGQLHPMNTSSPVASEASSLEGPRILHEAALERRPVSRGEARETGATRIVDERGDLGLFGTQAMAGVLARIEAAPIGQWIVGWALAAHDLVAGEHAVSWTAQVPRGRG